MDPINFMIRFGKWYPRRDAYFLLLLDEVLENERAKRIWGKEQERGKD